MDLNEFMGEVQHRLELATLGETLRAIRAVLWTLGERIQEGEATDLAGPLPMDVDFYLRGAESGQRFDYDEFLERVAERANVERDEANFYAQAIVALVADLVPGSEVEQVSQQLPEDFGLLFELVGNVEAFE
jgi:uncharacterized protein (DUF2267 family)